MIREDKDKMGNSIFVKTLCSMRILVIHNFYQHAGGEDIVFRQEVEELEKEHVVKTLTFQNKKGWRGVLQFLAYPWNIYAIRKVKESIKSFAPDIVHIHNLYYATGPAIIKIIKKQHIPVVMTLHNFRLLCPSATLFFDGKLYVDSISKNFPWKGIRLGILDHSRIKTFWATLTHFIHWKIGTWQSIDRFITLTDFSKDLFLSSGKKFIPKQFIVKPNFVDLSTSGLHTGNYYLFIGRLSAEKGIIPLIATIKESDKILKIVGDGPLKKDVSDIIKTCNNIELLGQKNKQETIQILANSKALIVPSVCYEGAVPLTIIEGMATHTPVLASNLGAIPDMIIPDETGWLFDPYQMESLLSAIQKFENSDKKDDIVRNAYTLYKEKFTKAPVMNQLTDLYHKITKT
ncbi:glycosyltransferase family 4 protein [Sphingobacterium sp. DN00404]|uniref:Glycosyltransferase family 4 protein n=1 Tax=Sphingobacterium micropteri TaxID=2763501 RepID=A0ABR7YRZ3_9SPHI|nr:glycosyltransferase family 4 protein [Sphingobacterium micropteri]MBD1434099.1 glycosyltransferase family 4 protein [Sphingobacterium micropteri]